MALGDFDFGNNRLPHKAMRRLLQVVDSCRGLPQVFVVFKEADPYDPDSVHQNRGDAVAATGTGLSYFGPVAPGPAPGNFAVVLKTGGTSFEQLKQRVTTVVLLDEDKEVRRFRVPPVGSIPNVNDKGDVKADIEAVFLTPASVDRYAIPYLLQVYGAEYAYQLREEWIKDAPKGGAGSSS
jgi:hypothetical protein